MIELEKIGILMQCASNVYIAELREAENVEGSELCSFSETGGSLIRLLLKIELIQERVIDAILEMDDMELALKLMTGEIKC